MKKIHISLFTILIFGTSFGQELMTNGNFENWPSTGSDFSLFENVNQESTIIHGGTNSAKIVATATSKIQQNITGIIAGNSYTISLWYKVESGDNSNARIWAYWLSGSDPLPDNANELRGPNNSYFDNNGNAWTQYSVTLTAPTGADGFRFETRTYTGATVYWDDLSFINNTSLLTKDNEIQNLKMFPNPTSLGYVTLSNKSNTKMSVEIFDLSGKQILNKTTNDNKLDVSDLKTGIYIIKVFQHNASTTKKLVVQ